MPINVFCELPTKQSQSECFGENSRSLPMAKFLRTTCCWTSPNFSSTSAHVIGPIYLLAHLLSLARSVERQPAMLWRTAATGIYCFHLHCKNTFHFRNIAPALCLLRVTTSTTSGWEYLADGVVVDCHLLGSHFFWVYKPRVTQEEASSLRLASQPNTSVLLRLVWSYSSSVPAQWRWSSGSL